MNEIITTLKRIHKKIEPKIVRRLKEFEKNLEIENLKKELFFCLLTPQTKAKVCWQNIETLTLNGLLTSGSEEKLAEAFCGVRFKNNKARYIVEARERFFNGEDSLIKMLFSSSDSKLLRDYIVKNVKGMGYKEASHFLRNIGKGEELAILDRHILRGLVAVGVIKDIPANLTPAKYLAIEKSMGRFAKSLNIPISHLDFVLWYFFNKEIFK